MKSNAHKVFAVLFLATFSVWVGCSHNAPPELSNLQRELNEQENEINRLTSENSKKDNQLKAYETKIDQRMKNASMQGQSSPEASL